MTVFEFFNESLNPFRGFQSIEVFSLKIFDKANDHGLLIAHVKIVTGTFQPCYFGSLVASFTGQNFILVRGELSYNNRI